MRAASSGRGKKEANEAKKTTLVKKESSPQRRFFSNEDRVSWGFFSNAWSPDFLEKDLACTNYSAQTQMYHRSMNWKILFGPYPVGCSCYPSHKLSPPYYFPRFQMLHKHYFCVDDWKNRRKAKQRRTNDRALHLGKLMKVWILKRTQSGNISRAPVTDMWTSVLDLLFYKNPHSCLVSASRRQTAHLALTMKVKLYLGLPCQGSRSELCRIFFSNIPSILPTSLKYQ